MADNFNINTTQAQSNEAGGLDNNNPAMTYVDFANQIAKNANTQTEQQQAIANAKLLLQQRQQAASMGVNPELKDYASVPEAVAFMKAMGLDQDTIDSFTQSLGNQQMVDKADIRSFIAKRQLTGKLGAVFVATAQDASDPNKKDENGDPLVAGQSYQSYVDPNTGETQYRRGGQQAGGAGQASKQWQALSKEMDLYTKSARGNALMNTVVRAKQALALLQKFGDNPPPQILGSLYADVGSIMTGGVGTQETIGLAEYRNVLNDLNKKLGYYTGHYNLASAAWEKMSGGIPPLKEIIDNLRTTLSELMQTAGETIKAQLSSSKAAYRDLIESDPATFQQLVDDHMKVVGAGTAPGALPEALGGAPAAAPTTGTPAPAAAPAAGASNDPLGIR